MEEQILKDLIDKLLIDDLSKKEMEFILDKIQSNKNLMAYYHETIELKEKLHEIADTKAFQEEDLSQARDDLFFQIDKQNRSYSLKHLLAAVICSVILTAYISLRMTKSSLVHAQNILVEKKDNLLDGNIIAMNLENISNERIIFSGKSVSDFQLSGSINDEQIQRMIKETILKDPNLHNRLKAVMLISDNRDSKKLLMNLIKNKNDNSIIRLQALKRLSKTSKNDNLALMYIDLLKEENNRLLQNKLIELLKSFDNKNQIFDDLKELFEKSQKNDLKMLIEKELYMDQE